MVPLAVVLRPARDGRLPARSPAATSWRGGAAQIYAVFDLGLIGYWALPTAPPWYAAEQGVLGPRRARACAA